MTGHEPAARLQPYELALLDQAAATVTDLADRIRAHRTVSDDCPEPEWCVGDHVTDQLIGLSFDQLVDIAVIAITRAAQHVPAEVTS